MGQSTQLLYPGPVTVHSHAYMHETTQGLYNALLQGRFAFDFVHEDRLDAERLSKYRALILPNIGHVERFAMPADSRLRALRRIHHGQF